jgi:fucose permease
MSTTTVASTQLNKPASHYELQSGPNSKRPTPYRSPIHSSSQSVRSIREQDQDSAIDGPGLPPPSTAVEQLERWNNPLENQYGVAATYYAFFVFGLNDASCGALIPYLERYYNLTYTVVSLIFLSPFLGYTVAALCNSPIHMRFGQRGIAVLAPSCRMLCYLVISFHPPYPVLVVMFIFAGFGGGLEDSAWCAWTGNMVSANKVQGLMQACYSLGATLSPLIATSMFTKYGLPWYSWLYVLTAAAGLDLIVCSWAFWHKDGARYRADNPRTTSEGSGRTKEAMKHKVTWLCAGYFFCYVGAEVALGGWIVTFMNKIRDASAYDSGIAATGFWAGMTVGRAGLGFVTEKFGERICVMIYLGLSIGLELTFWLVPQFVVGAVAVALLGMFLGPLFPAGIVICAKLLPTHLHVSAIGFATAIGGTGAAILPFAVGAAAEARGVKIFNVFIISLIGATTVIWLLLPRIKKTREV